MSLYDRFELLDLDRDDGVKTFAGREISTGRPVKVHLFVNAKAPLQAALLKEIDRLPAEELARVVDRGKHEGTPYVVTDRLSDFPGLSEWVQAAGRTVKPKLQAAAPGALGTAGAWKVPTPEVAPAPPKAAPASPPSVDKQFAELFSTGTRSALPETVILPPSAKPVPPAAAVNPAPVANVAAAKQPGEFTAMFQSPVAKATAAKAIEPAAIPPAPAVAPAPIAKAPSAKEPGEFTRMFQSPVAQPPAQPPAAAPSAQTPAAGGDFDQFFEPTSPAGPLPKSPAVQQPLAPQAPGTAGANKVGEFTKMFGKAESAALVAALPPVHDAKKPGEFTRMFQASNSPGGASPTPSSSPLPLSPSPPVAASNAAPAFNPPPPPPPPKQSGPGEYTRQFAAPAPLTLGQAGSASATPPAAQGFGSPVPPAGMNAPVALPAKKNNLPLILGIGAIVLVALIIVIVFAMRPK